MSDEEFNNLVLKSNDGDNYLVVGWNSPLDLPNDGEIYIGIRSKASLGGESSTTFDPDMARLIRDHLSTLLGDDEPVEEESEIGQFAQNVSKLYDALKDEGFDDVFAAKFCYSMFQGAGGKHDPYT